MSCFYLCDYCLKMFGAQDIEALHSPTCVCLAVPVLHPKKTQHDSQTPSQVCKDYEGNLIMEPNWESVKDRLMALTTRELKPIKRWFDGAMGGASRKKEIVDTMVSQMRRWWNMPDSIGRGRVGNVLKTLQQVEDARQ